MSIFDDGPDPRLAHRRRPKLHGEPQTPASWLNGLFASFPQERAAKNRRQRRTSQSDADLLQQLVGIGSQRPHWQAKHPQLKITKAGRVAITGQN